MGFPHSSVGKESTCNAGDLGSIPGSGRIAGEGINYPLQYSWASLLAQLVKNLPATQETWIRSLGWEDSPGGGHGNPLQCSCLENPHEQRSLADYSPWNCKESDTTEWLSTAQHKAHSGCSITGVSKRIHVWRERPWCTEEECHSRGGLLLQRCEGWSRMCFCQHSIITSRWCQCGSTWRLFLKAPS